MFQVFGAIGAQLERRPSGELALVYRFGHDGGAPPAATEGMPVGESPDVSAQMAPGEAADVVERRLSRHFTVKRIEHHPIDGVVREWTLSERSASPGLDQPMT